MNKEELLSKYLLAQKDVEKAIEENVDIEILERLMSITEYYKKEILKGLILYDTIKDFKISCYHSRHRESGYELCIEDNENDSIYKEISESQYKELKEVY